MIGAAWRFLWENGVGQNLTASALMGTVGVATGWALRGRVRGRVEGWVDHRLEAHHALLHEKLDKLLEAS